MKAKHCLIVAFAALLGGLIPSVCEAQTQPRVVAHRGHWLTPGSAQNSITAMVKADSIGAYATEFDVNITADSCLVVNHDYRFKGVDIDKNPVLKVIDITLDNGEPLPTLNEFLSATQRHPGLRLVLELKVIDDPELERYAVGLIAECVRFYRLTDRTDFISFSRNACDEFHRLMPDIPVYYLNGDLDPETIAGLGYRGLDYHQDTLAANPDWVRIAHDLGLEVNVWTVDDPEKMQQFIDMGVDYITTNKPELLQSLLARPD